MPSGFNNKNNRGFTRTPKFGVTPKGSGGFTLIELLVVVAIVGILSSVVLVSLNSVRAKARDAKRISDLRQIRNALELYYTDYGNYPVIDVADSWAGTTQYAFSHCHVAMEPCGWVALAALLQPYIRELPRDPVGPSPDQQNVRPWNTMPDRFNYAYLSIDGQTYDLVTRFEDSSNSNRCEVKQYKYRSGVAVSGLVVGDSWCGPYNTLLYAEQ